MTPTDIAGLCERLKAEVPNGVGLAGYKLVNPNGPEATTALTELSAKLVEVERERARLYDLAKANNALARREAKGRREAQAQIAELQERNEENFTEAADAQEALATATARIAELEGALLKIKEYKAPNVYSYETSARIIARQALERKP